MKRRISALLIALLIVLPVFAGCSETESEALPETVDEVKAGILGAGMTLSYLEDRDLLDEMVAAFAYECEGSLTCYLTGKDEQTDEELLWVLCFEKESDAMKTERVMSGELTGTNRSGRSGCLYWYGREDAVSAFLKACRANKE
ncbi:MAG: hypothetical protein ACI3XR_03630 [Eubacteriales bacterium]